MNSEEKIRKAKALRYKRPALDSLGYESITTALDEMQGACADVHYYTDTDDDSLVNALDGDEDEAYEFRIAFADFEAKSEQLWNAIQDNRIDSDVFDDCTVALIGNRYNTLGYDGEEEDYFSLTGYEQELAQTEAGKRFMRMTKAEMISTIGQCLGITLAFLDLRQNYDYLKAAIDVLRDENTSLLQTIREIDKMYDAAADENFVGWGTNGRQFDSLLQALPERIWVE